MIILPNASCGLACNGYLVLPVYRQVEVIGFVLDRMRIILLIEDSFCINTQYPLLNTKLLRNLNYLFHASLAAEIVILRN